MRITLILVSILLILFCIIISLVLSFKLSKPIVEMNENAKKLALANYDVKFLEEGPREIQELAATLNITTRELGKLDAMQKELIANISKCCDTALYAIEGVKKEEGLFGGIHSILDGISEKLLVLKGLCYRTLV
jgi:signal transduction histidine kinase